MINQPGLFYEYEVRNLIQHFGMTL